VRGDALIVFLRSPVSGRVKTRIAKVLGDEFTLGLYHAFLADLAAVCRRVPARTVAACDGPEGETPEAFSGSPCLVQRGHDMGERMFNAFADVFAMGFERAALIGSDLPDLPPERILGAFERLADADVVLGPAADGGYYLMGCRRNSLLLSLFSGMSWGGASVCADTIRRIEQAGLRPALVEPWRDIDTCEDLKRFYRMHLGDAVSLNTMHYLRTRGEADGLRI
jgi:hypothetical protein